ncbi:endonuclease V [Flexibacterium corallicola]|uniref:endonuclease V n=1 Tax=Flexibacterium corallicola TaxID=3037259 RepID=UPI00286F61ED|nr:endonuclease V [Pseudovibrio sp. M1P-2-3]
MSRWSERAREQTTLARHVSCVDEIGALHTVAGMDVSFCPDGTYGCAVIVVLGANDLQVRECVAFEGPVTTPYVPQFLGYREIPLLAKAFAQLSAKPDLVIYDGNGLLHARRCGAASQFGVLYDLPVIGCAKSAPVPLLPLQGSRGTKQPILVENRPLGAQLITRDEVKPLFVSIGHKVSLERACNEILRFTPQFRQPEPIRQADQRSRERVRAWNKTP